MAMAGHELNTPLTVLIANLQVLEQLMDGQDTVKYVQNTINQVNKLHALISDLLDVSKIQIGQLILLKEKCNLYALLSESVNSIRNMKINHQIIFNSTRKVLPVYADIRRIEQVFKNLLTNAIKYSPGQKEIFIDATIEDHKILISVQDTGIGIPAGELKNIFSSYYRVPVQASTFTGVGVGLYVTREIVKLHGGDLWVNNEIGEGSKFYFTLPLA